MSDPFGLVGSVVDRQFRVDTVIGEGGFGVVYKGWHLSLDQPIALKALRMPEAREAGLQGVLLAKFRWQRSRWHGEYLLAIVVGTGVGLLLLAALVTWIVTRR